MKYTRFMHEAILIITYIFAFLSVYVQIFFLVSFFERRKDVVIRKEHEQIALKRYPSVTVIVPCYNEEDTIEKTVRSLLVLDYPSEMLSIMLIDDGSKDGTWKIFERLGKENPQITAYHKENGGKHTAMNFGLEMVNSEFIGCLDSDSFVHPQALKRIMHTFEMEADIMAVAPSIIVHEPKNILQKAQKAEYDMSVYNKRTLGFLRGIHVAPGPFSIFRKKVFNDLGPYRKAHNTEDQEIALRMHAAGYRIDHCPDAYVYTISPNTIMKLYRQRLRWVYGFIKNAIDYRRLLFQKKYGTVGTFTIPSGFISIISVVFILFTLVYGIGKFSVVEVSRISAVGFSWRMATFHFDWFFINTRAIVFIMTLLYAFIFIGLLIGRKMAEGRYRVSLDVLYFVIVYSIIAPFWLMKALWNAAWSKESNWVLERSVSRQKQS